MQTVSYYHNRPSGDYARDRADNETEGQLPLRFYISWIIPLMIQWQKMKPNIWMPLLATCIQEVKIVTAKHSKGYIHHSQKHFDKCLDMNRL